MVSNAKDGYNNTRPHQSLGYDTPDSWYHSGLMAA
jgi:transposase InsO family protein